MTPTILIAIFGTLITVLLVIILLRSSTKKNNTEDQTFLILQEIGRAHV